MPPIFAIHATIITMHFLTRRRCHCFGLIGFAFMVACSTGCLRAGSTVAGGGGSGGGSSSHTGGSTGVGGSSSKGGTGAGGTDIATGGSTGVTDGSTDGRPPDRDLGGKDSASNPDSSTDVGRSSVTGGAYGGAGGSGTGGSAGATDGGPHGGTTDGGAGGKDGGPGDGGSGADGVSSGGSVSCAGFPVWNSKVTYNTPGQLVEYNCKLYQDQGFAFGVNPETNNGQYYQWLLMGSCSESDCAMGEGPWIACGNYDHWTSGAYEVFNDVWGGGAGPQCITAWNGSHFTLQTTQPATSGVKSYPNSGFVNVGKAISSLSTFTSNFDITVPSDGDWEATYDVWVPTEIMIWMYTVGNVGPIATSWDPTGKPVPSATDVSVGGHTWNVYHQNGGNNVISFVRTTNTTSATVDILALVNWARTQGWIPDGTIGAAQFGFEISGTNNVATDFACNSFSLTVN